MNKIITAEVVVAYSLCPRKAFLLLEGKEKGKPHEYVEILEEKKRESQSNFLRMFQQKNPDIRPYIQANLKKGSDFLTDATLQADGIQATCGLLTKVEGKSSLGRFHYEPTIFVGTCSISKEQRVELFIAGYVLEHIQKKRPIAGKIITVDGKSHKVKLEDTGKTLNPLLRPLHEWIISSSPEEPLLILNKHCSLCPFQGKCKDQAEKEDNLSLLSGISTYKQMKKYERKGIFTVNQLSFLYRPRKQRKRSRKRIAVTHSLELQALVIRTGKIYLQEIPEIPKKRVELFLDIEGIPDQQLYYLIGLLVSEEGACTYHSFWADTTQEEGEIWQQVIEKIDQYPGAPIYHYGSYDSKAIDQLGKCYETDIQRIKDRLVNINGFIYGKVYFPLKSNRLKEIGKFIGASWSSMDASGQQSLVWRHYWDETHKREYQKKLMTYNKEDCQALKMLTDFLANIRERKDSLLDMNFYIYSKKSRSDKTDNPLHRQLENILNFAHADYNKDKISFRQDPEDEKDEKGDKEKRAKRRNPQTPNKYRKPTKIIHVPQAAKCPKCGNKALFESERKTERILVDLSFSVNGMRKSVIKKWGYNSHCPKCKREFPPSDLVVRGRPRLYGHGFKILIVYQRIVLRLSYQIMRMAIEDMFNESLNDRTMVLHIREIALFHCETEKKVIHHLLESPFLHADETPITVDRVNQYVWVLTDGKHVVFKHTETREAKFIHDFLCDYKGILISDFYSGYDSLSCRHQKCLVHLIRDINSDLWASPFDIEYRAFVFEVKNLMVPIMEAVQKYGLKRRNLNKFTKHVDRFYKKFITDKYYRSELCQKYQQRFKGYRESLFTFLENDGIPWQNNPAENAIRHLCLQEVISYSFRQPAFNDYLLLLGIRQTCRFQDKSFMKFLRSGATDIDGFKG